MTTNRSSQKRAEAARLPLFHRGGRVALRLMPLIMALVFFVLASPAQATTTHYRSVGNGGIIYQTGTASCSASTTVTFSGTLPSNVGEGDKLTIDVNNDGNGTEVGWILTRDNDQQVTLQAALTRNHSGEDFKIERAYASISAWESDRQRDLTAATGDDSIEVAVCYKDNGPITEDVEITINGWTTGPNNYIRIYAPASERHTGTAGTGFVLKPNYTGGGLNLFEINVEYVRIEGIELDGSDVDAPQIYGFYVKDVDDTLSDIRFDKMLVHDITKNTTSNQYTTRGIHISDGSGRVTNSIVYNITSENPNVDAAVEGITIGSSGSALFYNNTVYNVVNNGNAYATYGMRNRNSTLTAINNYVGGTKCGSCNPNDVYDFGDGITQSYNISSDDTASGTGSQTGKAPADQFVSITSGSEDFHLKAGSACINSGTSLSGTFTDDMEGESRPYGSEWEVGADEFVARNNDYTQDANIVSWWYLDESSGTRYDGSSNNNDLNDKNTVTFYTTTNQSVKEGAGAASFDRSNTETLWIPDNTSLSITGNLTLVAWARFDSVAQDRGIIGKTDAGVASDKAYYLYLNAGPPATLKAKLSSDGSSEAVPAGDTTLVANTWYHVALVYNGTDVRLYLNGSLDENGLLNPYSYSDGIHDSDATFAIGSRGDVEEYFGGQIDEVAVFDRALSAEEINVIYERGLNGVTRLRPDSGAPVPFNSRSIGEDTGTIYSDGKVTLLQGSRRAYFTGATLPSNIGEGDVLTIGGLTTYYIAPRESDDAVMVQAANVSGSDHTLASYTITRAYSGSDETPFQNGTDGWEDEREADLVTDDAIERGISYKDSDGVFAFSDGVVIDGSTTDNSHFMWLTAHGGARHSGTAGTGVVIDAVGIPSTSTIDHVFKVMDPYLRIEWLEIKNLDGTANGAGQPINLDEGDAGNNLLAQLIIHDYTSTGRGAINVYENATVRNCIIYNGDKGIRSYSNANLTLTLENVTIYNMTGTGVHHDKGRLIVKNTISVGTNRDFDLDNDDPVDGSSGYNMYSTVHNDVQPGTSSGAISITFAATGKTITRGSGSFLTDGFVVGNEIKTDASLNPGPFTISDVTASVITVNETVVDEGPVTRTVFLDVSSINKQSPPASLEDLFVSTVATSEDLHLEESGHNALNNGVDLSTSFTGDIDGDTRPTGANTWDIGADEVNGVTAVTLVSFEARGYDGHVALEWETGSERDNLGFNLFRREGEDGPFIQINSQLILGLFSSDMGGRYLFLDRSVTNGKTYWYLLEDVELGGDMKRHGPASATPRAEGGAFVSDPSGYVSVYEYEGDAVFLVRRETGGTHVDVGVPPFSTEKVEIGATEYQKIVIEGYGPGQVPGAPDLPTRTYLVAVPEACGYSVNIKNFSSQKFSGYEIPPVPRWEVVEGEGGETRLEPVYEEDGAIYGSDSFYPPEIVSLGEVVYVGEERFIQVIVTPVQYNPQTGEIIYHSEISFEIIPEGDCGQTMGVTILQNPGASLDGVKVGVSGDGLFRLGYAELQAAGFDVSENPSLFQMLYRGEEIAIRVVRPDGEDNTDGSFDPGDGVVFYGKKRESIYGERETYWLIIGDGPGLRMVETDGTPGGGAQPVGDYEVSLELEENAIYWASLPDGEGQDYWFWDYGMAGPFGQDFTTSTTLTHVADGSGELTVYLQGYTEDSSVSPDHHVRILFNGLLVDDAWWDGKIPYEATIPVSNITEGLNTITVEMAGDTGAQFDIVYIEGFELTYSHSYETEGNLLDVLTPQVGDYTIEGFTTNDISVYDTTNPDLPQRLDPLSLVVTDLGGTYSVNFEATGSRYVALTESVYGNPDSIVANAPSDLTSTTNGADEIIIAYGDFIDALSPLVSHREGQGLRVSVIDVEDIFDEFSYGNLDPQAIKDFLGYAYTTWSPPRPEYVLLVGDGTYDYKDYLDYGDGNFVPVYLVETPYRESASDNWYATVSGEDILPDLHIGRLPARTVAEAQDMVAKILAYEGAPNTRSWEKRIVLVADEPDGFNDFEGATEALADLSPGYYTDNRVYTSQWGEGTRDEILSAIDTGALLVNYLGHGSLVLWSQEAILSETDVDTLSNTGMYPVVVAMDCLNGNFAFPGDTFYGPYPDSLSEALVKPQDRGAIAVWASSGETPMAGQVEMNEALFDELFVKGKKTVGEVVSGAKVALAGQYADVITTWVLFGDPAMEIKTPQPHIPTGLSAQGYERSMTLSWNPNTKDPDLLGYNLYRATSGGTYTKVNPSPITGTSYGDADLPEGTHTYLLRAVDTFGLESGPSETASASISSSSSSGCFVGTADKSLSMSKIGVSVLLFLIGLSIVGRRMLKNKRH